MIKSGSKRIALLLSFFLFIFCVSAKNTYAQSKINALNENNITFFIQDMTAMTSGGNLSNSQGSIVQFLDRHLHPKARFKSALQYNIPGFPTQENSVSLNKEQFIENIQTGSQTLENYETSTEVHDIKISKDSRKATLRTVGYERGTMSASGQQFPVEGNSTCNQIIMLSENDIIQIYHANCKTTIRFQEF